MRSSHIGDFIKGLRKDARISLRQLAEQADISNPYLSQIERGLRKPSAEVLAQLAEALRVSTPVMYLKAGLLGSQDSQSVTTAIAADPQLTVAQKQSLTQIYETFVRENLRSGAVTASEPEHGSTDMPEDAPVTEPARKAKPRRPTVKKTAPSGGRTRHTDDEEQS